MSITRVSAQALRVLDENPRVEIHSVFARAVNLRAGDRLITCTSAAIAAPHGVESTDAGLARLQRLHHTAPTEVLAWHARDRSLRGRTGNTVLSATVRTTVFTPGLPVVRRDPMSRPVGRLIGRLARVRAPTGFGDEWLVLTADPRMRDAVRALLAGTVDDAVLDLIGRGPGLTPSGDDVVVGMIAALWCTGAIDASRTAPLRQVLATGALTTDISAEYLRYACRGMVTGVVHDLLFALDRADSGQTTAAVDRLRRHGHTSGTDCLLGVLTGLRHLAEDRRRRPSRREPARSGPPAGGRGGRGPVALEVGADVATDEIQVAEPRQGDRRRTGWAWTCPAWHAWTTMGGTRPFRAMASASTVHCVAREAVIGDGAGLRDTQ